MDEEILKNKRWYDLDPTVSLAVNMLEQSSANTQIYCADYIIEEAKNRGINIDISNKDSFNYLWKRWQDKDEKMFEAMEYFKIIDFETKKQLSLEIISYIKDCADKIK